MQIFIKLNYKTIAMEVTEKTTILEIKQWISDREGYSDTNLFNITYAGKIYADDVTIENTKITENTTLHVAGKLLSCAPGTGCNCRIEINSP